MGQQFPSLAGARRILSGSKNHITSDRVGQCSHGTRRFRCMRIDVHSHLAKIVTRWLAHPACRCVAEHTRGNVIRFLL
jgi:hypothetical protein